MIKFESVLVQKSRSEITEFRRIVTPLFFIRRKTKHWRALPVERVYFLGIVPMNSRSWEDEKGMLADIDTNVRLNNLVDDGSVRATGAQ